MPLHRVPTCTQYSEGLKLPECRICQGYPDYFHNSNCIFKWNIFLSLSNNCLPVSTFINDKIGLPFSSSSQNKYFFLFGLNSNCGISTIYKAQLYSQSYLFYHVTEEKHMEFNRLDSVFKSILQEGFLRSCDFWHPAMPIVSCFFSASSFLPLSNVILYKRIPEYFSV